MKTVKITLMDTKTPPELRAERMANREHIGQLAADPVVGRGVVVFDDINESGGLMTSTVQEVTATGSGWEIKTRNSIYQIQVLSSKEEAPELQSNPRAGDFLN